MKKSLILFITLLFLQQLYSQTIVWESEYLIPGSLPSTVIQIIKDSDNNYVSFFNYFLKNYSNGSFIKYSPDGQLIKYSGYSRKFSVNPLSFYETEKGYRVLCGINNNPNLNGANLFPDVMDFDKDGSVFSESIPYNIKEFVLIPENVFSLEMDNHCRTVNIGKNFYVGFSKRYIKVSESKEMEGSHILLAKYDSLGRIEWRKGYDTIIMPTKDADGYFVSEVKKTNDNNIVVLIANYGDDVETSVIITELDTNGQKLRKLVLEKTVKPVWPRSIACCDNGDYIVSGELHKGNYGRFYWRVNSNGKTVKYVEILSELFTDVNDWINSTPDGSFIANGYHIFNSGVMTEEDDSIRFSLRKLNSELETVWDYEWYDHHYQQISVIQNVIFLDNDNIIVTGYKDRYKFYIAQINIGKTDVKENQQGRQAALAVRPQPFRDVCEINVTDAAGQYLEVSLYDINGHKIMNLCSETARTDRKSFVVNGSGLPPGVYFVEAKAGNKVLREKIIKTE